MAEEGKENGKIEIEQPRRNQVRLTLFSDTSSMVPYRQFFLIERVCQILIIPSHNVEINVKESVPT